MYDGQVPRPASAEIRLALVERAAEMLAQREPVTLRALVAGTGASTMAVYTHFGGISGLWRAVRQEGFVRLGQRLAEVPATSDPVRDLMALGSAYVDNALAHPNLYRAMFDAAAELDDAEVAARPFQLLITAARRAQDSGRFADHGEPEALATQLWAAGHGLTMLVLTGVLPQETLPDHSRAVAYALFVAAGDEPDRCRRSVAAGWAS